MSLAGALAARGIGPGDAVAVQLPNVPEWVEIAYGARRLGAMCVAVNTRFGPHEVRDILERSRAKLLVTDVGALDADAPEPPDRSDPDAPWMVFTSSGTTGAPKLVAHTPRGIDAHAAAVADAFGLRADDAVVLVMLPLCGVFGFCTLTGALAAGCPYVLLERFDAARASELIGAHRATHTTGSDEMIRRLLEHPTGSLRDAGFAAFNLPPRPVVGAPTGGIGSFALRPRKLGRRATLPTAPRRCRPWSPARRATPRRRRAPWPAAAPCPTRSRCACATTRSSSAAPI